MECLDCGEDHDACDDADALSDMAAEGAACVCCGGDLGGGEGPACGRCAAEPVARDDLPWEAGWRPLRCRRSAAPGPVGCGPCQRIGAARRRV